MISQKNLFTRLTHYAMKLALLVSLRLAYRLVAAALKLGFSGIGIAKTFIHVDTRTTTPVIWVY